MKQLVKLWERPSYDGNGFTYYLLYTDENGNGMSENDVMVLAGHSNFATTHEFYLAVADDLVDRARRASTNCIDQNLLQSKRSANYTPCKKIATSANRIIRQRLLADP